MNTKTKSTNRGVGSLPHRPLLLAIALGLTLQCCGGTALAQHDHKEDEQGAKHAGEAEHAEKSPFEWGGVYELPAGVSELVILSPSVV